MVSCFVCMSLFGARTSHRNFFSDSGLTMLSEAVAITDSSPSSPVHAPWSVVESASASQVVTDLCSC